MAVYEHAHEHEHEHEHEHAHTLQCTSTVTTADVLSHKADGQNNSIMHTLVPVPEYLSQGFFQHPVEGVVGRTANRLA